MAISSLHPGMSPDDLHAIAVGFNSVEEADIILKHSNCSKSTKQMVVAKLHLFSEKDFKNIPDNYHSDIIAIAQQRFGDPMAATG